MHIVIHHQIKQINATAWNGLLDNNNPFMRHEYLNGLEICECVNAETGWQPMHIAAYVDASQTELLGAMPCYLKTNSYGEYIFDWAWADLYYRNNHDYYPKLTNAIPFTPATGARWLTTHKSNDYSSSEVAHALLNRALSLVEEKQLSGFHSLFVDKEQSEQLVAQKLLQRITNQFHWQNNNYADFAAFLACMNSKKRKNIKRERRRVNESNIHYQWITGEELTVEHAQQMYQFYRRTINHYGAQPYLNSNFYQYLTDSFADQTLFLFAKYDDQVIAGGLYFKSDNTLYGRYWGALNNFHSVHFETCYYQAIEWCIQNNYQRFEAGAQGEHKLARGLEPNNTYSAHWIKHPQFRQAIADFLEYEKQQIADYSQAMQRHSPFKNTDEHQNMNINSNFKHIKEL